MADKAIELGSRRELFVDGFLIEEMHGNARLRMHHPQSGGVAMPFDQPWEGAFSGYCTVVKAGDRYRLYYRGWGDSNAHPDAVACVAESSDGITFERPNLGLYEVKGSRKNNVILADDPAVHNFAPMVDDNPNAAADQRYKALADNREAGKRGLGAFVSADGVQWKRLVDGPVITKGAFDSQNVPFWSTSEGCYLCYFRVFVNKVRSVARTRSDDFVHWTEPVQMGYGDTTPEQLYTNQTLPYYRAPHIYVALPGRFMHNLQILSDEEATAFGVHDHRGRGYWLDCADAVFMTTRGGNQYDRTFMEAFVRPGRDRRNWTSRCNYPARGIVQTGDDEMSMYIERYNAQDAKFLERLTMRLDGFASLYGGYTPGWAQTKPLTFAGSQLTVNYETSAAGRLRVEIQDEQGKALPGYSLDDCDPLIGDEVECTVSWQKSTDLAALTGRPVRLSFELKDADLYSIRFSS